MGKKNEEHISRYPVERTYLFVRLPLSPISTQFDLRPRLQCVFFLFSRQISLNFRNEFKSLLLGGYCIRVCDGLIDSCKYFRNIKRSHEYCVSKKGKKKQYTYTFLSEIKCFSTDIMCRHRRQYRNISSFVQNRIILITVQPK